MNRYSILGIAKRFEEELQKGNIRDERIINASIVLVENLYSAHEKFGFGKDDLARVYMDIAKILYKKYNLKNVVNIDE